MRLAACPLSRLTAPASRLPPRVLSASGRRPAPTDAAAETGRWATSHRDVAAPKGKPSLASPFGGRWCPVGTVQRLTEPAGESAPVGGGEGQPQSCPRAEDGKMALLGSNPHKTWVFEQCHVALFVEIALLLYFKLLKQTPSENRFLWFELCHSPLNCAIWHCSQSRINTGFFANSAKFSSQAVGRREGRSLLGEIDKF